MFSIAGCCKSFFDSIRYVILSGGKWCLICPYMPVLKVSLSSCPVPGSGKMALLHMKSNLLLSHGTSLHVDMLVRQAQLMKTSSRMKGMAESWRIVLALGAVVKALLLLAIQDHIGCVLADG